MARCLVIGGNGFIGSHVVDSLAGARPRGDRVRPSPPRASAVRRPGGRGRPRRLPELGRRPARRSRGRRSSCTSCRRPTRRPPRATRPSTSARTSPRASQLFAACADAGVAQVYFASSGGAIYGDQDRQVFAEDDVTLPVSPYAIGKQAIESYLRYFRRDARAGVDDLPDLQPLRAAAEPAQAAGRHPDLPAAGRRGRSR